MSEETPPLLLMPKLVPGSVFITSNAMFGDGYGYGDGNGTGRGYGNGRGNGSGDG